MMMIPTPERASAPPRAGVPSEDGRAQAASAAEARPASAAAGGVELSIVVPTFNEADNVRTLVERLTQALEGVEWEVIFTDDDSPDGTSDAVRALARSNRRVRCLQRIGRRGLSSACVEGMLASSSPFIAVMDADLQHDERILPAMLRLLRELIGATD